LFRITSTTIPSLPCGWFPFGIILRHKTKTEESTSGIFEAAQAAMKKNKKNGPKLTILPPFRKENKWGVEDPHHKSEEE
jgi:hypothetical protein